MQLLLLLIIVSYDHLKIIKCSRNVWSNVETSTVDLFPILSRFGKILSLLYYFISLKKIVTWDIKNLPSFHIFFAVPVFMEVAGETEGVGGGRNVY